MPNDSGHTPSKRFKCHVCDKLVTRLARHLIRVHKMDAVTARGYRYDNLQTKKKKVMCPLCDRKMVNLYRHLVEVEKIPRHSEEWKDVISMSVKGSRQLEKEMKIFNIPAYHPQKQVLSDYIHFRQKLQQKSLSTVKKEMGFILDCLRALHRSQNLDKIFKAPSNDGTCITNMFNARILTPIRTDLDDHGEKVASGHYNRLLAFRSFLGWLIDTQSFYLTVKNLSPQVQTLRAGVKAAMSTLRAAKKMRSISINRRTKPINLKADLPIDNLLRRLEDEATWANKIIVRDIIMTVLAVGSIARFGALRNMTRDQVKNAQVVEEDGQYVRVEVTEHKTMKTYGAAGVYLTHSLMAHLKRYLDERQDQSPWVFSTASGNQLSASQAAIVFKRLTRTTATNIRKSVAIANRERPQVIQSAISEAMLHSFDVHRESYAAKTHQATIFKGLQAVGAVQCLQGESTEMSPQPSTSEMSPQPGTSRMSPQPGTSSTSPQPGTSEMSPQPGTSRTSPQPGTSEMSPQPGTSRMTPQPGTSRTSPQPGTSEMSPQPGTSRMTPQPGTSRTSPQPGTSEISPQPGTSRMTPQPGTSRRSPQPGTSDISPQLSTSETNTESDWTVETAQSESSQDGNEEQGEMTDGNEQMEETGLEAPSTNASMEQDLPSPTSVPKGVHIRFHPSLQPVSPSQWSPSYIREKRVLKGMLVPSRNKFTTEQLQVAFRYLGGYSRSKNVPSSLIRMIRRKYPEFDNAFRGIADKTICDKIRAWPIEKDLIF